MSADRSQSPTQVVGRAVQDLTAARLGRGFVPLGLLAVGGVVQLAAQGPVRPGGWILLLGSVASAVAMLAYGLRGVQRAFGRPRRTWMKLAGVGALVPLLFGLYVLGWRGLRAMALGGSSSLLTGAVLTVLGAWSLWSWLRVMEVHRLAETMSGIADVQGGEP